MKISLPARDTIRLFCLLFVISFPSVVSALCDTCPATTSQTLTECEGVAFNLDDITVGVGDAMKFYETCGSGGALSNEIMTSTYNGSASFIYVEDIDTSKDPDSCLQIFRIALVENVITATINPPAMLCGGNDITLSAVIVGGTGSISYDWGKPSGDGDDNDPTYETSTLGVHTLEITRDGCVVDAPDVTVSPSPLSATLTMVPANGGICLPGGSVALTANVSGASGTPMYSWNGAGATTSNTFSATTANTQSVIVSDANCTLPAISVETIDKSITVSLAHTSGISCFGVNDGSVTATVGGSGDGPYNFTLFKNGASHMTSNGQASPKVFSGLGPGMYHVTASDTGGGLCSKTSTPLVEIATKLQMTIDLTPTSPQTIGGSDGSMEIQVSNGTAPYTWKYVPGPESSPVNMNPFVVNGLAAGTYEFTVTDDNDCTATDEATILPLACPLTIGTVTTTPPNCAGEENGKITLSVSNANGAYRVDWARSGGGSGQVLGSPTMISNLFAGTYSITVTDAIVCSKIRTNIIVNDAIPVTGSASQSHVACTNGTNGEILVTGIGGGAGGYVVTWGGQSSAGTVSYNSTNATITGLIAGSYSVSITDSKGCDKVINPVAVAPASPNQVSITGTDKFCAGQTTQGQLTASANPNTLQSFAWTPGGGNSAMINIDNPGTSVTYSVIATDANGCKSTGLFNVDELDPIVITLNTSSSKTSVNCDGDNDGSIFMNTVGGNGGYSFAWTGPNNFTSTSEDITNLFKGTYSLVVTDNKNCIGTFIQEITTPLPITASISISDAVCKGDSNGAASVSATGGNGTLTYKWSPGGGESSSIANLSAGIYTVTVTDANGCFKVESAEVKEPNAVVGVIDPVSTQICNGESVELTVSGGSTYAWNNGLGFEPTVTVSPIISTTYTVIVTDANTNNCTDDVSVLVTVNQLPVAAIAVSETSGVTNNDAKICDGDAITLTASGGATYNWTGGQANPLTLSPNSGTETYTVTVTDTKGCKDTESIEIEINENPTAIMDFSGASQSAGDFQTIKNVSIANCGTIMDCNWTIDGSAEDGDCTETKPTFTSDGSKNIKLSVTNSCGCTTEKTDVLEIFKSDQCAIKEFTVNNGVDLACVGKTLSILTVESPTPGSSITNRGFEVFENGIKLTSGNEFDYAGSSIVFNKAGTYEMKFSITDALGCDRSSTRSITIVPAPAISFAAGNLTEGCEGEFLNIKFDGFDAGEKVVVQYSNGSTFTYEIDSFDFQLGENATETLKILSVQNSTCAIDIVGQEIVINVTPKFKIEKKSSKCEDDGLTYTYTIVTSGGNASENIIATGINGIQSGDNFIITGLIPTETYTFNLSRGGICASIDVEIPLVKCFCTFEFGENNSTGYAGCESDVFDISGFFMVDEDLFDPVKDTIVYVLHNQNTGLNLGSVVYGIYPYSTTVLSSDFEGFVPNITTYRLSAVGIRRAQLEEFDFEDPSSFRGLGSDDCLSVKSGVPMTWFAEPTPQLGTLSNDNIICRNAYDYMLFATDVQDGSTIRFEIDGVPEEEIKSYGFQDTVFAYFNDNGQDSFVVKILDIKEHFSGESTILCAGQASYTLYVKEGKGSPPLSEIILWPGNILASTADSTTTCYEWGFENFGQLSGVVGTGKYLFAASDIDFKNTTRTYFVDTYFCDNPSCVTRVYFNADGPNPGLNYKEEESFRYQLKPNPSNGNFTLDLFSDVDGSFELNIIDITGKKILNKESSIFKGKNAEHFNLDGVEKGIYFIQIINKDRNEYSIDKLVIN